MSKSFVNAYSTILWLLVLGTVVFFAYVLFTSAGVHLHAQLFEDGSYILGNVTGCIPGGMCN